MNERTPYTRQQRLVIVYGMMSFILVLLICQIWLITATVHAFLGGDDSVVWPAAIASFFCLALSIGLLRYLYRLERAA
ncbi:MAG: hypothetical protein KDJ47_01295 [Hyphomicrobiaceae bacterium]|nr:hypothetical protein [Anaerolineae bacterium]MCA9908729.1 hypothetical protein [Anaerolineae bacterium]MCB1503586.1 hypothetical protein [Hyphomicrobiaceae bacterium]